MPKLTIDGMEITVEPGTSIIQAAERIREYRSRMVA
jgi:NADH dehydrogenase/NADH:ubiquinone oxidoreductase subunit G